MPTSSRLIVLQGDKERHIHWVGGQPGGVDCGEFAVGEAACGQLYPFLFFLEGAIIKYIMLPGLLAFWIYFYRRCGSLLASVHWSPHRTSPNKTFCALPHFL